MRGGFFGKLPSHGDFVSRGLSDSFLDVWDRWLQACIARSQEDLGEDWLDRFLTSPVWRFVLSAGAVDDKAHAGFLFPSVDRVGRYFPMTAAWEIPEGMISISVFDEVDSWMSGAEAILLEALDRDQNDLDAIAEKLAVLAEGVDAEGRNPRAASTAADLFSASHWRIGLEGGAPPVERLGAALFGQLVASNVPLTLWWTGGSPNVGRSLLGVRGLPESRAFSSMIDGFRESRSWKGDLEVENRGGNDRLDCLSQSVTFKSSAATTVGKVRAENEDSFCERTSAGLWAVADGMGGHSHGEVASRMVTDSLGLVELSGGLEARMQQVRRALDDVNRELRRLARTRRDGFDAGSTVVVVVACGNRAAAIWAGDSRAYRVRKGALEILTSDHVEVSKSTERSNVITRAVGAVDDLDLETRIFDLRPGDRLLLCSDGVYGEVAADQVGSSLDGAWREGMAERLLDQVMSGRAKDNATVVIVECVDCP